MTDNGQAQSFRQVPKRKRPRAGDKSKAKYSAFDYRFRATVLPDLKRAAHRLAWAMPHGVGFNEALDTLIRMALDRDAGNLADLDGLIEYLSNYLAACALDAEPQP